MNTENLSTLKIHKLTQAQYEREKEAGRIDENALYLTPDDDSEMEGVVYAAEESVDASADTINADTLGGYHASDFAMAHDVQNLTADDVGARPDTWLPTITEIGAAPAGFGLGETHCCQIDSANNITANGWYRTAQGTPDANWWLVFACVNDAHYQIQEAYRVYDGTKRTRTKINDAWSDWVNISPSAFAPAGFGYGEAKYFISWDDSDGTKLENYLDGFFTDINNRDKIYRFTLVDYPACVVAGQGGYADIVCTDMTGGTPQSITIVYYAVDSSDRGMAIATKKKHSGVWCPWEYVNPPMIPGIEYRTTERWNSKAVYTAILELGAAPNSITKSVAHPPEIKPTRVTGWSGYMVNTDNVSVALPTISDIMEVQIDNYGASLFTKDDRSNFYVYLKIKYIK